MNPSEVRRQILGEHDRLRERLDRFEADLARAMAGDAGAAESFRRGQGELLAALRAHVESEEAILVPALEAIDAWGPARAARIHEDHVTQLRLLATWDRAVADPALPLADLGPRLRQFAGGLRADMEAEENDLLHPDLLRDDVVSVQQSAG
jgi:hypothetical protein